MSPWLRGLTDLLDVLGLTLSTLTVAQNYLSLQFQGIQCLFLGMHLLCIHRCRQNTHTHKVK